MDTRSSILPLFAEQTESIISYLENLIADHSLSHAGQLFECDSIGRLFYTKEFQNLLKNSCIFEDFQERFNQIELSFSEKNINFIGTNFIHYFFSSIWSHPKWKEFWKVQCELMPKPELSKSMKPQKKKEYEPSEVKIQIASSFIYVLTTEFVNTNIISSQSVGNVDAVVAFKNKLAIVAKILNAIHLPYKKLIECQEKELITKLTNEIINLNAEIAKEKEQKSIDEWIKKVEARIIEIKTESAHSTWRLLSNLDRILLMRLHQFFSSLEKNHKYSEHCHKKSAGMIFSLITLHFNVYNSNLDILKTILTAIQPYLNEENSKLCKTIISHHARIFEKSNESDKNRLRSRSNQKSSLLRSTTNLGAVPKLFDQAVIPPLDLSKLKPKSNSEVRHGRSRSTGVVGFSLLRSRINGDGNQNISKSAPEVGSKKF